MSYNIMINNTSTYELVSQFNTGLTILGVFIIGVGLGGISCIMKDRNEIVMSVTTAIGAITMVILGVFMALREMGIINIIWM